MNITNYSKKNMVNINIHKATLINIIKRIYDNPLLRTNLGFKGGTAAMLFYNLPRLSVDLDFDLLNPEKQDEVFTEIKSLLSQFSTIKEATIKRYTLFFLISYEKGERNLKIEISRKPTKASFSLKNYLGISVLVMDKNDMMAGKLAALLTRKKFAARDLFDLWFFMENRWSINEKTIKDKTGLSLKEALKKAKIKIKSVKKNQILHGLGDLLDNKQKIWAREQLLKDLLFLVEVYGLT